MDEVTIYLLQATQAVCAHTYRSLKTATQNPTDEIDAKILETWTSIQTMLGERLTRLRDAGEITQEQWEFIIDWLSYWVENGPEESEVLLNAWIEQVKGGPT